MKFIDCFCFTSLLLFSLIDFVNSTCVLESDFGFKINCAFKKSGLFRVRNLGGLKAHASLGFSLGDELGFEQSLTNMDPSRRRSVSVQNGGPFNFVSDPTVGSATKQEKRGKQNRVMMRPAPGSKQAAIDKLTSLHRHASSTMRPIIVTASTIQSPNTWTAINPTMTMAKPLSMGVPPFKPLPPKEDTLKVLPITAMNKNSYMKHQIPQSKGPGLFYNPVPVNHQMNYQANNLAAYYPVYNTKKVDNYNSISGYGDEAAQPIRFNKEDINAKIAEIVKVGNISMEAVEAAIALRQQQLLNKYANIPLPTTTTTTTTQRTTTTEEPLIYHPEPEPDIIKTIMTQKPRRNPAAGKVMNAPREYYPVGYEKNFDDQFQSKVDLPETNFHCGEQKYFPGLYGDESLGCMVFHVCALTDDGLVMKSFLCPESTLFDQTILKCNWWFYVDCKNTRRLYDTNMPVSKSYELMKALTFFSSYKKEMQEDTNPEDVEGIKEAIIILENQNSPRPTQSSSDPNALHVVTSRPVLDERHNHKVDVITGNSSVSVANRSYSSTNNNNSRRISAKRKSPESRMRNSEYKLVTVNADLNFNNQHDSGESRSSEIKTGEIKNEETTRGEIKSDDTKSSETKSEEIKSAEIKSGVASSSENVERKHRRRLTLKNSSSSTTNHPPAKRLYRSSAEVEDDKDINLNSEKAQIIRATTGAKLVGEFPTPTATIAKLDEAILGTRVKREAITVVPQQRHQHI